MHNTFGLPFLQMWRSMVISLVFFTTWKPNIKNKEKLVVNIYEKLSKGSLYEWFTPRRELKPHLKKVITKGTTSNFTHFSILKRRLELKDEVINVLKNMWVVGQNLSMPIVQSITKRIFDYQTPKILKDSTKRGFKVTLP